MIRINYTDENGELRSEECDCMYFYESTADGYFNGEIVISLDKNQISDIE